MPCRCAQHGAQEGAARAATTWDSCAYVHNLTPLPYTQAHSSKTCALGELTFASPSRKRRQRCILYLEVPSRSITDHSAPPANASALRRRAVAVDKRVVQPIKKISGEVRLPGSKSLSNRALLLAALADGVTTVENLLVRLGPVCTVFMAAASTGYAVYIRQCSSAVVFSHPCASLDSCPTGILVCRTLTTFATWWRR